MTTPKITFIFLLIGVMLVNIQLATSGTESKKVVLTLRVAGGYVPADYAFLDEAPQLVVHSDGTFIKRTDNRQTGITIWKEGRLGANRLKTLLRNITQLGFWKWDETKIQKEISKKELITDLPTTVISVLGDNERKTVSIYGLNIYFKEHALPSLKNPARIVQLLDNLTPQKINLPNKIEFFAINQKCLSREPFKPVPWPMKEFPVESADETCRDGARAEIKGPDAKVLVNVLSKNLNFEHKGNKYVIRYRPKFK